MIEIVRLIKLNQYKYKIFLGVNRSIILNDIIEFS